MAYTFSVNNNPTTGSVAMYQLISTLMSAGWLKKMDSDGTTYSSTGVQVSSGASGAGGLGNTNAWVRLQSPPTNGGSVVDQTRELTIQRGTTDIVWRVKYSASALFTGGNPGISQTPSSTDEIFCLGAGTDASPTFIASWFPANNTYRWHIAAGGAAEFYSFVAWGLTGGSTSSGLMACALDVMAAGSYSALDVDPAVIYFSNPSASATGIADISSISSFNSANVTNACLARAWLGSTSAAGAAIVATNSVNVNIAGYGNLMGSTSSLGSNPWTGADDLFPALWTRAGSLAPIGIKGFSTLFQVGSVRRTTTDTCNMSGTRDRIFVNVLWLPWSGALPLT